MSTEVAQELTLEYLKEDLQNNFGNMKLITSIQNAVVKLANSINCDYSVRSGSYKDCAEQLIELDCSCPNVTTVRIDYKSYNVGTKEINYTLSEGLNKINRDIEKFSTYLVGKDKDRIREFLNTIIYNNHTDCMCYIDVEEDDTYLSLTITSPSQLQKVSVEIY